MERFLEKLSGQTSSRAFSHEEKRTVTSTSLTLVGLFLICAFTAAKNFFEESYSVLPLFIIVCISSVVGYYLLIFKGFIKSVSALTVATFVFAYVYSVKTGLIANSGLIVAVLVTPVFYQILGHKKGAILCLLLFLYAVLVIDFSFMESLYIADYTEEVSSRFYICLLFMNYLSFIQEYSRFSSQRELRLLNHRFEMQSMTDELTRLHNRRSIGNYLETVRKSSLRASWDYALIIGDIDLFKNVNDKYGHSCGDSVLKLVAEVLKENTREEDWVARWGGEEFLIVLPRTNLTGASIVAEKLRAAIEAIEIVCNKKKVSITMSFGVSSICATGLDETLYNTQQLLKEADERLYEAKDKGRNQIVTEK